MTERLGDEVSRLTFERLRSTVAGEAVALRSRMTLQPAGGEGDKVFPPSYAVDGGAQHKYAVEERQVGDSVKETWKELERRAGESGKDPIDISPLALRDFPIEATAPKAQAPLLLKTYMDAWTQTSPEPIVQPSVEWFLHGLDQDRVADVSILWRWDRTAETLRLVPPRQAEFLQVPLNAARSRLADRSEVDVADVSQAVSDQDEAAPSGNAAIADCVRWKGFGKDAEHIGVCVIVIGVCMTVAALAAAAR